MKRKYPATTTISDVVVLILITSGIFASYVRLLVPAFKMMLLVIPPALLFMWLAWRTTQPRTTIRSPLARPLFLLILVIGISSLQGVAPLQDVVAILFFWGGAGGVLLFLIIDILATGWHPHIITRAVIISTTLLLLYAATEIGMAWITWLATRSPTAPFLAQNVPNNMLSMHHTTVVTPFYLTLPLVIVAWWQTRSWWWRVAAACWVMWAVLIIFYSTSRGGWLALAVVSGLTVTPLVWHAYRTHNTRRALRGILISGCYIALFSGLFIAYHVAAPLIVDGAGNMNNSANAISQDPTDRFDTMAELANPMGRQVFWSRAIEMVIDKPLLGMGPGGFPVRYKQIEPNNTYYTPPHTHNLYLAFASELGVIGVLLLGVLLSMVGYLWVRAWQHHAPASEERMVLLACGVSFVGLLVHGVVEVPPPQQGMQALFIVATGLSVGKTWQHNTTTVSHTTHTSLHLPHILHIIIGITTIAAWGCATLVFLH